MAKALRDKSGGLFIRRARRRKILAGELAGLFRKKVEILPGI